MKSYSKIYRVELMSGKVWFVKCDKVEVDGRRVCFLTLDNHVVRSWLVVNVLSWKEV